MVELGRGREMPLLYRGGERWSLFLWIGACGVLCVLGIE